MGTGQKCGQVLLFEVQPIAKMRLKTGQRKVALFSGGAFFDIQKCFGVSGAFASSKTSPPRGTGTWGICRPCEDNQHKMMYMRQGITRA